MIQPSDSARFRACPPRGSVRRRCRGGNTQVRLRGLTSQLRSLHRLHSTRHALPALSSPQMESGLHLQDVHALTSELKSSASAWDDKTEELWRVHREQERAFCKRGWRCFAWWRNFGA